MGYGAIGTLPNALADKHQRSDSSSLPPKNMPKGGGFNAGGGGNQPESE